MSGKLEHPRRPLSLHERIDILEGEAESSDADHDLDMGFRGDKDVDFDEYLDSINAKNHDVVEVSSDSGEKKRKRGKGKRIAFDDDEDSDAAYQAFKRRKSEKRKQAVASTKRARTRVTKGSLVGLRPKTGKPSKADRPRLHDGRDGQEDEESENEDEVLMESTLPDYLKQRRNSWDEQRAKMGNAGLRIPPDDDDVYFSGDERMERLKERPILPQSAKQRKYKDIDLPLSAGIIPAPIAQYLRDYQVRGTEFLHEHFVYQKGGILGDDMGLGKTIQVIAFLTAAFGKTGDERDHKRMRKMRRIGDDRWYPRVLIVCPGTLMTNWRAELERWGWWHIYVCHGSPTARQEALSAAQNGRLEIMITTYTSYRLHESAINGVRWDCVIADECHVIKGTKAEITQAMNKVNALCRIGLTGTAIQNNYDELWCMLNWTNPGRFGPLSNWKQAISDPLRIGQSHDATVAQLGKARRLAEKLAGNLLPQFFLRRMKSLIAHQLPKKSDQVVFCPMTEIQAQAYNNICDSELVQCIRNASEPCPCGSGRKQGWCCYAEPDGKPWKNFVFPCLVWLQKLANHAALLVPNAEADKDRHDKDLETLETALPEMWRDLYRQRDSIANYSNVEFCGKWKVLKKLLKLWYDAGDKVLVFSHSVRLLKMLNMLFKAKTGYNVSYLDGSMSYTDRQQVVDDYNSDPKQFVFLISTRAGGVGLNITSANKVVVVDPNWNPSYDLQAQDRAYRIGQTRDVQVFRLVSVGTLEEIVYARQIYKQQQANIGYNASVERRYFKGVQDNKDMKGEIFGLANLFAPLSENVRLRDIVNKTNIAETRAGVEIAGLDLEKASQEDDDDDDDAFSLLTSQDEDMKEDAAMSQLAADIIDAPGARRKKAQKTAKRKDAVQAILASVGVEYTHENAEVVGTSKVEMRISSRAQKAGNDIDLSTDYAFIRGSQSQTDGNVNINGRSRTRTPAEEDLDGDLTDDLNDERVGIKYKYRPPPDVCKRQFCSMAKHFGYEDITEFALIVEGWTQKQRRDCLEKFYRQRRAMLARAR